jgi:hypothetical protein
MTRRTYRPLARTAAFCMLLTAIRAHLIMTRLAVVSLLGLGLYRLSVQR